MDVNGADSDSVGLQSANLTSMDVNDAQRGDANCIGLPSTNPTRMVVEHSPIQIDQVNNVDYVQGDQDTLQEDNRILRSGITTHHDENNNDHGDDGSDNDLDGIPATPPSRLPNYQPGAGVIQQSQSLDTRTIVTPSSTRVIQDRETSIPADIHVIEFQKRGLPHSHLIITLAAENKPLTPEQIDKIICAEIPDKNSDPLAYEMVTKFMLHGPCGAANPNSPCMVDGKCSKNFPKKFCNETTIDSHGFVSYCRSDNPHTRVTINGFEFDNRWVVPYNRDLLVRFNAHINVERVASPKLTKYLYKYVHKGHDRATIAIEDNVTDQNEGGQRQYRNVDEVKQFLNCRYVSSIEACWRIFKFDIQRQYPAVERLQYHLPGQQVVVFNNDDHLHRVMDREHINDTMLTKWFEANRTFDEAKELTYVEFPTSWTWVRSEKKWKPREHLRCVGRLPYAHPSSGERYYLRMLLHKVRGAEDYTGLRTINGVVHDTFKAACQALGLLDDDNEWHEALTEASTWASAIQLRNMICTMLLFSDITSPVALWDLHWSSLTDDILFRLRRQMGDNDLHVTDDELKNLGLVEIELILGRNGRSLKDFPPMPLPSVDAASLIQNRLIREELDYDSASELSNFETLFYGLNNDQKHMYDVVIDAYLKKNRRFVFVYGSGGTGKTYLWRTLIAKVRSERKIVLSVASSGIASLLLPGGRTAHSRFKIPVDPDEYSCCSISQGTELAKLIQEASLIIWDEAPMIHKHGFKSVDRTFRDILKHTQFCDKDRVFEGKLFVVGGDFRQTLPVVSKARRAQTVDASIQNSSIWEHCTILHLRINMRVRNHDNIGCSQHHLSDFSRWIMDVGDGKEPTKLFGGDTEPTWIKIPGQYLIKNDSRGLHNLISMVYPDLVGRYKDLDYLQERCILAPTNTDVDDLNSMMLEMLPGDSRTFLSADSLSEEGNNDIDQHMNPPEFLHSLNLPGLPLHCLKLKKGSPVMLLRNLNQSNGLCNGTRLTIQRMSDKVLEATIITGSNAGESVLIPRIVLTPSNSQSPFPIKRRQFPIRLAFSVTINKSQGQTLKSVGVYLPKPVFSHGQLYVALSRVTTPLGLKMLIINKDGVPHDYTKNVVFHEVLQDIS